jgi:hypothetical protein
MVRAASWGIILSIWLRRRPYQVDGACVQVCGKTIFFHPHQSFVRPYTTPDNASSYHTHGPCPSRELYQSSNQLSCHGAIRPPIQSWLGKFGVWRIAAHKFERNVFGLHRPAIPASASLRPIPHRSWWSRTPGSWKNGTFPSTLPPAFEEPPKDGTTPGKLFLSPLISIWHCLSSWFGDD